MKMLAFAAAIALAANGGAADARHYATHSYHRSYAHSSSYYTNVSGHRVHRPTFVSSRPRGASAHCADGSWSFSEHARGTCSHHGGVAGW